MFGFPWILSSESRLINGLRGIFAEKFFLALLPGARIEEARTTDPGRRKRRAVHRASLALFLIFCKIILTLVALPSWPGSTRPSTRILQTPRKPLNRQKSERARDLWRRRVDGRRKADHDGFTDINRGTQSQRYKSQIAVQAVPRPSQPKPAFEPRVPLG